MKQVDVSATTGSFGILPDHVPAVSVLKPGLLTVYEEDSKTVKYFGKLDQCPGACVHCCLLVCV